MELLSLLPIWQSQQNSFGSFVILGWERSTNLDISEGVSSQYHTFDSSQNIKFGISIADKRAGFCLRRLLDLWKELMTFAFLYAYIS